MSAKIEGVEAQSPSNHDLLVYYQDRVQATDATVKHVQAAIEAGAHLPISGDLFIDLLQRLLYVRYQAELLVAQFEANESANG